MRADDLILFSLGRKEWKSREDGSKSYLLQGTEMFTQRCEYVLKSKDYFPVLCS